MEILFLSSFIKFFILLLHYIQWPYVCVHIYNPILMGAVKIVGLIIVIPYSTQCSDIWIDLMKKLNDPNSFTVKKVFTDETTASEDMSHTASREQ